MLNPISQTEKEQIEHLPDQILRDVARNDSSARSFRKAAVKLLMERKSSFADHPDFSFLAQEIREEKNAESEVHSIVETAIESSLPSVDDLDMVSKEAEVKVQTKPESAPAGPFAASFTTANL